MPETSIQENGDPQFGQDHVRFPGQRVIAPPAGDPQAPENLNKPQFGGLIATGPDCAHDAGTFIAA
jgi:hypothetical protein